MHAEGHLRATWLFFSQAVVAGATTEEDYNFKFAMLDDLLTIVDMENMLTGEEKTIGGFDLVYKGELS
ncbi:hypothetical protein Esti_004470 [Eimeria stiedai]